MANRISALVGTCVVLALASRTLRPIPQGRVLRRVVAVDVYKRAGSLGVVAVGTYAVIAVIHTKLIALERNGRVLCYGPIVVR
jgi:hypothetical protein